MRARTRVDHFTLETQVETSLAACDLSFLKHRGSGVAEFEVVRPCHFRVTVEDLDGHQFGYPLRSPIRVESAIGIYRTVGQQDSGRTLPESTSRFAETLRKSLPRRPWKGFGFLGSRSERRNWENLAEVT